MATLSQLLADAEAAYHSLMIGKAVVQFRDANGEFVQYSQAKKADLLAYINDLKAQITPPSLTGPMRIFF